MTQRTRVLAALMGSPRGITAADFDLPGVIDGGAPIQRVAARVNELRREGHLIAVRRERGGVARYILRSPPTSRAAPAPTAAMLDLEGHRPASPYDPLGDWS